MIEKIVNVFAIIGIVIFNIGWIYCLFINSGRISRKEGDD